MSHEEEGLGVGGGLRSVNLLGYGSLQWLGVAQKYRQDSGQFLWEEPTYSRVFPSEGLGLGILLEKKNGL